MPAENRYLLRALEKSGYVIMVVTGHKGSDELTFEYVSPNAEILGMSVKLLSKGLKLPTDYVHPEDRKAANEMALKAIADGVDEYTYDYRMVGDNGKVYNVRNELTIVRTEPDTATIECYIREVRETAYVPKKKETEVHVDSDALRRKSRELMPAANRSREVTEVFASLAGLYSVVLSPEGKSLFPAVGPDTNLGDFYDLFQTPRYRELFEELKEKMLHVDYQPKIIDRPEGGIGKLSAVPLMIGGELQAVWVIGSYTQEETDKLSEVYEKQWSVGALLEEFLKKSISLEVEVAKARGAGKKLREELSRQNIANEALTKISSSLIDRVDQAIAETLHAAGMNLDVDRIFLYTMDRDRKKGYKLRSQYSLMGAEPDVELLTILPERMDNVIRMIEDAGGRVVADRNTMTEEYKLTLMRYSFNGVVIYPIYLEEKIYGMLFFAEASAERVWTKEELRFTKSISLIIQKMIENADGDGNLRRVNRDLIETYNTLTVAMFVRDLTSGEVLFSNTEMDKLVGYEFTGTDSRRLIVDLHDRFDSIDTMRKPFINKERVTNWRSYLQPLGQIMDITEIRMEWLRGEPASMIFLRKPKD